MANFTTTQDQVEALYTGYFGRAADPAGLSFWMGVLNSGGLTYGQVSASFSVQAEATTKFPYLAAPTTSNASAFVDQVYADLFNRPADTAGKAFWLSVLATGNNSPATVGAFITNVIAAAQGTDSAIITNKVAVAGFFTNGLTAAGLVFNAAAAAEASAEVTATNGTLASVTTNETRSTVFDATTTPPAPQPGQTFALSAASTSVNEGQQDLITLSTTNVSTGTILGYTITGIAASRVTGGLTGTVTVDATGHAVINLGVVADNLTDGATTAVVSLNNGAASTNVIVNDTSTTPGQPVGLTFTLTSAIDNFIGGSGNDTFLATYSDGGTNTFNVGDTLAGGTGIDTLNITPSIQTAATTLTDGLWNNVSGIENLSITTGPGVISITTGAAFQAAFGAGGVNLTATTTGGAINIDMTSFTGAETVTTSSGAGAETIVTGSGVSNVTAASTAGALTIHGAGLATVSATTTGAGAQTIGDLIGGGANLVSVTATANAGAQTIHSTSTSAVTVNATDNGGPQIITTGAGNDTIVIGSSSAIGTINAGAGANSITLGATHSGVDQIVVTLGNSVQAAPETITNFSMAVSDTLALGSTTLLNSAQLGGGFTVTSGIATATGGTLAAFLTAATTSTTAGVVAFINGADTYVVASDGLASGAADSVVHLVGVTATAVGGAAAAGMIHIV